MGKVSSWRLDLAQAGQRTQAGWQTRGPECLLFSSLSYPRQPQLHLMLSGWASGQARPPLDEVLLVPGRE